MHAVQRGDSGKTSISRDTVRLALEHVAEKFVKSDRYSPALNSRGCIHIHIYRQTKDYKTQDPSTNHEKSLPPIVFKHRLGIATLPHEQARVWLVCIALCFPMRSCEYAYMGENREEDKGSESLQYLLPGWGQGHPTQPPTPVPIRVSLRQFWNVSLRHQEQNSVPR